MQLGPSAQRDESQSASYSDVEPTSGSAESELQTQEPSGWIDRFKAENSMIPNLLLMVGMIIMVFLMYRSLRKTHKANAQRSNSMGSPSERIEEIRHHAQSSMEPAQKLMVEAEDIARRLGAVLDNKAARLELLIEEADAKLDQLNRAVSNPPKQAPPPSEEAQESTSVRPASSPRAIDPSLLDRARLEQDQHERESRVAGRIEPESAQAEHEAAEISISDQIHELALSGKTSQEIAQELKQPIGQVELILNLQRRAERS
ncbi:MAG: hypothetical protein NXI07_07945 [bacterium]|nr:hypothetical protein [bacterium]